MGQEQSVPAPRRAPNKLSKPRTNSSGNLISKIPGTSSRQNSQSNNASPTKSRQSLLFPADVISEAGEKKEEKQRKRMSFLRSKSSQAKEKNSELELDTGVEREFVDPNPVERPVRRHSRANSVTFEEQAEESYSIRPPNHTRMSLQHFPYQQHHSRLSLVAEVRSPEPAKAEPSKRLSHYEEENPQSSTLPRTNSEPAIYGPIRRRSLLQHGVATRKSPFAENDSRQSLPSQINANEFQDYYYNPAKPTSSPLSNIANLGREFENGTPGPRVETPTDLGYGHIGVFKLGSLRITNGTASPAPSEGRPSTSEDYITAGARRSQESAHRHGLSQRSNTLAAPIEIMRPPWVARSESPLRQTHEPEPEPLSIDTHLPLPDPSFALFDFSSRDSPTKSLELAKEYIQDLALSPFSFENSPPASPRLESTSKHMAVEDELFDPEPNSPNLPQLEHAPRSFDSGYGTGESAKVIPGPKEQAPKPLAKADSGYSSNVSLRSFKKDGPTVPEKEAPPTPPKEVSRVASSTYSVSSRVPSSTYSVSSQASDTTLRAQRSLPSLPAEEYMPPPPPPARDAPPVPPKHAPERPSASIQQKHTRQQSLPATIPKAIRPEHALREKSSNSSDSSTSHSKWRPQKQRPHSFQPAPVYTVSALVPPSSNPPPVPAETSRKLDQRVDAFPVACFPNTIAGNNGLRKSGSKETLGTIFSVGSMEVRAEMNFAKSLPPVPVHSTIPEYSPAPQSPEEKSKPEFNRRNTFQPASSTQVPAKKPFEGRRSMQYIHHTRESSLPRKSIEQQQDEFEAHVTSFESISSSLGTGPYAIATTTIRPQSSGANARAKSVERQFEVDAAARFQEQRARNSGVQMRKSFDSQRTVSGSSGVLQGRKSFDSQHIPIPTPSQLQNRKSYDSIAASNPFSNTTTPPVPAPNTPAHSRKGSREYPPQAHSNSSIKRPFSFVPNSAPPPMPNLQNQNQTQIAEHETALARKKSPPPVSMQTQNRKSLPPPSRTPPTAPQPPPHSSFTQTHSKDTSNDAQGNWAKPANFWAERRKSAGEALQSRKSIEMSRPGSARPSAESSRPAQNLRAYPSFDQRDVWEANHASQTYSYDYDYDYSFPGDSRQEGEGEYYEQQDTQFIGPEQARNHARGSSTAEMLVLGRETGGHGQGLSLDGKGGGRWGSEWGVDLCDVPVFLHRVRVES